MARPFSKCYVSALSPAYARALGDAMTAGRFIGVSWWSGRLAVCGACAENKSCGGSACSRGIAGSDPETRGPPRRIFAGTFNDLGWVEGRDVTV